MGNVRSRKASGDSRKLPSAYVKMGNCRDSSESDRSLSEFAGSSWSFKSDSIFPLSDWRGRRTSLSRLRNKSGGAIQEGNFSKRGSFPIFSREDMGAVQKLTATNSNISSLPTSTSSSANSSFDGGHAEKMHSKSFPNLLPNMILPINEGCSKGVSPVKLTTQQLHLVQATWQAVISDVSNICLNFFLDVYRLFPQMKRRKGYSSGEVKGARSKGSFLGRRLLFPFASKAASGSCLSTVSSPSLHKAVVPSPFRSDHRLGATKSELSYHALKFACAVDSLIVSLLESYKGDVNDRTRYLLEDIGEELFKYLRTESFTPEMVKLMTACFVHSIRLVFVHSGRGVALDIGDEIEWTDEVKTAWQCLFHTLIYYLEGTDDW